MWLAGTDKPTMLDIHVAPFWEIISAWQKGPFSNITDQLDLVNKAPHVVKFVDRLKTYPMFREICLNENAHVNWQSRARRWEKGVKCQLSIEVLERNCQGKYRGELLQ